MLGFVLNFTIGIIWQKVAQVVNLHDADKEKTPTCWAVWDYMGCSSYFMCVFRFFKTGLSDCCMRIIQ